MEWKKFFGFKSKAFDKVPEDLTLKKPVPENATSKNVVGLQGKNVTVNPSASQKLRRLHGRVERLGLSLIKMEKNGLTDTDKFKSFKQEYEYKLLKLQYNLSRGN